MTKIFSLGFALILLLLPLFSQPAFAQEPTKYFLSFGPLAQPDSSWTTAKGLITMLTSAGYDVYMVERWHNDGWDSHIKGLPFNNFPLSLGSGYVVGFQGEPLGNPFAALPYDETNTPDTLTYQVWPGLNFFSIPGKLLPKGQNGGPFLAEDLCTSLNDSSGQQVTEINKLHGPEENFDWYPAHICNQVENDFPIESGKGYFIKSKSGSYFNWTLSAPVEKTISTSVSTTFDDVNEENGTINSPYGPKHPKLWLGTSGDTQGSFTGLRFTNLPVPKGASIKSAKIEVYSPTVQWISLSYQLAGEATGDGLTFSQTNKPSQRQLTASKINHSSNIKWPSTTWITLEDIVPIIQEVVNHPDWNSGNDLSLIFKGTGTKFARKFVTSFDGDPSFAPKLIITFQTK